MKAVLRYTQPLKSKPWVQDTFQEIKNPHSLWVYHLTWKYLFLLHSMNLILFCLTVWVIWPLANPTTTSVLCKDRTQFFCHDAKVWLCLGQLPCISCWDYPLAMGDQFSLLELISFLSLVCLHSTAPYYGTTRYTYPLPSQSLMCIFQSTPGIFSFIMNLPCRKKSIHNLWNISIENLI